MALADVPGMGAYYQRRQMNQQQPLAEMQQAQGAMGLMEKMRERDQEEQFRVALAQSGGDVEKALQLALSSGNVNAAAKLAPLAKLAQERRDGEQTEQGLAALMGGPSGSSVPQNPMVPGPGASVMAGSGEVTPMPTRAPDASQGRAAHLKTLAVQYANNPVVLKMIQDELKALEKPEKTVEATQLGKLIRERDALRAQNPNHPDIKIYDQAITKFQPGGVTVNLPPNAPLIPGKTAQNKVDEGLLDAGMRQQQLKSIESQFKPEYQQLGSRFDAMKLGVQDKIGLTDLDPGQKQFLTEFSQYKRNAIDALNQYIKSVTGAAMTNAEAERILRGLPNVGTGLFDGDSPTEFKAKLDDALRQTRMAEARLVYIKRNGLNLADVDLDRMPSLMNQRGAELEKAIKAQNGKMADTDVRKLVRRNLAQEFGLIE